jgi:hypothetical protein
MICGIDVDALIGGLQDKLNEAKDAALGMVNQLAADAKAEADKLKESMESEIRGWMPELPEMPELPKLPMSVELMALASKMAGYAGDLANNQLPQDAKDAIAKEMAKAKKAFKDSWGEGLEKQGIDLDKLLDALDGKGDLDPCALIPNLQKGADGLITMAPNMPTFPTEGALKEIKSEISASATEAKGAMHTIAETSSANVNAVAKQMQAVQDPTSTASAHDIKQARRAQTPSSSKTNGYALSTAALGSELKDTKEHKFYAGVKTYIVAVDDDLVKPKVYGSRTVYPNYFAHEWPGVYPYFSGGYFPKSSYYNGREMTGFFYKGGIGKGSDNEILRSKSSVKLVGIMNPGDVAMTPTDITTMNEKLQSQYVLAGTKVDSWYKEKHKSIVDEGKYTFHSAFHKNVTQETSKNPNGSSDFYSIIYNFKIYQSTSTSWW